MTTEQETLLLRHVPLTTERMADPGVLFTKGRLYFGETSPTGSPIADDVLLADAVAEIVNAWAQARRGKTDDEVPT